MPTEPAKAVGGESLAAVLAAVVLALVLTTPAAGRPYLPPKHKIYLGVTGGDSVTPAVRATGRAPAVFQHFVAWGRSIHWTFARARRSRARLMLHMSTYTGPGTPEIISPGQIARGDGDDFIRSLGREIVSGYDNKPVYLRLMAEMNAYWNPYAYYNGDGSRRDRAHRPYAYRQAFRRVTLILRGGSVAVLDRRLRRLDLPALRGLPVHEACVHTVSLDQQQPCPRQAMSPPVMTLPQANVAMQWVPQTMGSPNIPSNMPARFYPGDRYVDWVGTDFYSKYPAFHFLQPFYRRWAAAHRKPFEFGEWAMWGADDPAFARRFIGWVRSHPRVRLISYNQGNKVNGPFKLSRFPRASSALRALLRSRTFAGRVPEYPPRESTPGLATSSRLGPSTQLLAAVRDQQLWRFRMPD